jgi:hypothetical protein
MAQTGEPKCTLNGFLNNYVTCFERLSDAVEESTAYDPPPPEVGEALRRGERPKAYYTDSPRARALRRFDSEGPPSLESWFIPSLEEARRKGAMVPIADFLIACRRAMARLREVATDAKNSHDKEFLGARDAVLETLRELESVCPLVEERDVPETVSQEAPPQERQGAHPGELTVGLPESAQKAWSSYGRAIAAQPDLAGETDQAVFDWIVENDKDSTYTIHDFANWSRYLRAARRALKQSKYQPRAGRSGRSIAGAEELRPDHDDRDDE